MLTLLFGIAWEGSSDELDEVEDGPNERQSEDDRGEDDECSL